ncbi:MAG: hypothetical protein HY903_06325 [Deltaproteobacteria bacterium]|nr:hypothetical protein [Deltaproteobacteria bacterium]
MATKKGGRAPAAKKKPVPVAKKAPPPITIADPPLTDDPKAQADYFMQMLDTFAQQGTPEAMRLRTGLIEAVEAFGKTEDKAKAAIELRARVAGLELGVAELLVRTTRKLRDRLVEESRKLGTSSKIGKSARQAAEGFTAMVAGLEKLAQAAEDDDPALRAEAHRILDDARSKMDAIT